MGRRIEVELTSSRDDGSWTWRAAGAKQPKGDLAESLLYDGAKVGDVVKVEAEFHLDGIEVTEVFAPKAKKERTNLLEMKSRPLRDDELVTTKLAKSERRGDRKGGRDRGRGRGRDDDRNKRRGGGGSGGGGGGERRGPRPEADRRPRPKRLRPRRVHRDALLAEVTEEHRPIVEQVMKDGMPGVRAAIEKQNAEAKEAGKPEIDATPILAIAEKNLGKARLAEWRDRADAAMADAAELDIRDLRSVVVAGADVARDDESRALADQIKKVLDERLESDHAAWLADLSSAVSEGRVVRGLRLSSRPVKAGAPLPTEIASKLAQQASDALAADVMQDRWATVLDALAFSPVRGAVNPTGIPAEPNETLLSEVRRLSDRIPAIAALFGIDPAEVPKSAKRRRPQRKAQKDKPGGRRNDRPAKDAKPKIDRPHPGAEPKVVEEPAAEDAPAQEAATAEEPTNEAPATDEPSTEEPATEEPATEAPATDEQAADGPASDAPAGEEAAPEPTAEEPAAAEDPAPAEDASPAEEPVPAEDAPAAAEEAPADEPAPAAEEPSSEDAPAAEATPADDAPAAEEAAEATTAAE